MFPSKQLVHSCDLIVRALGVLSEITFVLMQYLHQFLGPEEPKLICKVSPQDRLLSSSRPTLPLPFEVRLLVTVGHICTSRDGEDGLHVAVTTAIFGRQKEADTGKADVVLNGPEELRALLISRTFDHVLALQAPADIQGETSTWNG